MTCGEESYNDQVWLFAEEETLKEFGKKKLEDKVLLMGMRYEKKDFPRMYGLLFSIDANTVIWNNGTDEIEIDLEKIVRRPDLSKMEPAKRPVLNPALQLSFHLSLLHDIYQLYHISRKMAHLFGDFSILIPTQLRLMRFLRFINGFSNVMTHIFICKLDPFRCRICILSCFFQSLSFGK